MNVAKKIESVKRILEPPQFGGGVLSLAAYQPR